MSALIRSKKRESNFELLRIFAMFLIVLHHCNVHGIFSYWHNNSSILHLINNSISLFLSSGGKIGVTLFIFLTGYFSCQQNFKLKKWLSIYFQLLFYSISIFFFYFWINPDQARSFITSSIFPLTHNTYWFITSWLILYAFSPLLNTFLKSSSPKIIRNYLLLGLILWVILPMFGINMGYSNLIYFMYLYVLGGTIKLNLIYFPKKILLFFFLSILFFTIAMISSALFFWENHINLWVLFRSLDLNTLYTLSFSLFIFYIFKDLKIKSPFINWISSSMFGVYLIHDNNLIRPWLWHTSLKMDICMNSPYFFIWSIVVSLSIFALCIIIDKLLSLVYTPLISYLETKLSKITLLRQYF